MGMMFKYEEKDIKKLRRALQGFEKYFDNDTIAGLWAAWSGYNSATWLCITNDESIRQFADCLHRIDWHLLRDSTAL